MATLIDYEHQNENLPKSLREFLGTKDRVTRQDFYRFQPMYQGVERQAIFNNAIAAEIASGYTDLNYTLLRSGAAPRLLKVLVSKAGGKVWYQVDGENEKAFSQKLAPVYFRKKLYKGLFETAMTGRSIMCLYGKKDKLEIASYNLFRHKLKLDGDGRIVEAWIYIVKLDGDGKRDSFDSVVCEHRFYRKKKNELGEMVETPFQEFTAYGIFNNSQESKQFNSYVPLTIRNQYPDIKFNVAKELPFPSIGVYDLRYTSINSKWVDSDIPEAMFLDAVDNAVTLESTITDKEVEKELGRGQVLVPEFEKLPDAYDFEEIDGRMMRTVDTGVYKDPLFKKYPSRSSEDSKPQNIQFDIRSAEWISQIDSDTARLCASVGLTVLDYDPRLLQSGERTDDEINYMTSISATTIKDFRELNEDSINKMLTDIATIYELNVNVSIRWSMEAILNPTKNSQLIISQYEAGLISKKAAVRRLYPDLTDNEIESLLKQIEAETKANPVTIPQEYENF